MSVFLKTKKTVLIKSCAVSNLLSAETRIHFRFISNPICGLMKAMYILLHTPASYIIWNLNPLKKYSIVQLLQILYWLEDYCWSLYSPRWHKQLGPCLFCFMNWLSSSFCPRVSHCLSYSGCKAETMCYTIPDICCKHIKECLTLSVIKTLF